jgi:hypothetical protein
MIISERIQSRISNLEKMSVRVAFHAAGLGTEDWGLGNIDACPDPPEWDVSKFDDSEL